MSLAASNMQISARSINFGATERTAGFNITGDIAGQLQQATSLTLRSARTMDFSGPVNFALAAPPAGSPWIPPRWSR